MHQNANRMTCAGLILMLAQPLKSDLFYRLIPVQMLNQAQPCWELALGMDVIH